MPLRDHRSKGGGIPARGIDYRNFYGCCGTHPPDLSLRARSLRANRTCKVAPLQGSANQGHNVTVSRSEDFPMPTSAHQACIDACIRCAQACENCHDACLQEKDVAKMAECIRLDKDCSEICWTAAAFMSRGSRFMQDLCRVCAEICEACGAECRKHKMDHCQQCADACDRCAEECRRMAGAAA